jgi:hypothetical protein
VLKCAALIPGDKRIAVHWAMIAGTHPFFFDVAAQVGRLIKLHGQANRSQIKRHMTEAWGDRSTLERAVQHALRSMMQWGLLRDGEIGGSLIAPSKRIDIGDNVAQILAHSVLLGNGSGLPFSQLTDHPALFPFVVHVTPTELMRNPIFRVQRQGDRTDFVELA